MTQEGKHSTSIYLIGSLANPNIPHFANELREKGYEVFDEWWSPGPLADAYLLDYAKKRNLNYKETLNTYAAKHIFEFDKCHIDLCDIVVMLMKAGKSAHLELGYAIGTGKPGFILFDKEPDRVDVMYQFSTDIFFSKEDLFQRLEKYKLQGA